MNKERSLKLIHDLNNILCACSGFTEMLIDVEDREYQKNLLDGNLKGIIRMSTLLEDYRIELLKEIPKEPPI